MLEFGVRPCGGCAPTGGGIEAFTGSQGGALEALFGYLGDGPLSWAELEGHGGGVGKVWQVRREHRRIFGREQM